jgi:hypothetical protein
MPDELTEMVRSVSTSLPAVSWTAPDDIRRAGRRRQRRAVIVALAVVVAIAAGAGTAYRFVGFRGAPPVGSTGTPSGSATVGPTPTPSTPRSVPVPGSAMLQLDDLPADWRVADELVGGPSGPDGFPEGWRGDNQWILFDSHCSQWTSLNIRGYLGRQGIRWHDYEGPGGSGLFEVVERYADPGAAAAVMDEVRRVVDACGAYQLPVSDLTPRMWGDESWTFTARTSDGLSGTEAAYFTVVRKGELVAFVNGDPDRKLGPRVAQRLCAATTTC